MWKKRHTGGDQEDGGDSHLALDEDFEKGTGPRKFSFNELALATTNFSKGEKLGEGGFGWGPIEGMKEYASEVKIFCRLRHRNLVQLVEASHPCDPRSCQMDARFQPRLSSGSIVPAKDVRIGCPDTPSDGFVSHG
ncbi:L-type lectin-domain containing receptor kinase IX.1 [Vitis vinifera]|uniref:L-type lectin-domain containing receptor kinase IX.1 n=1 Tax=Vitis vinifera TaxID=29760 RepID=A0A438CY43_VITVI|nr:L-type lectin-domain containing receptor kinase IX.1 [Vitis vinifera]